MPDQVTIAELVRNGTMNADMAGVLWAAVDAQLSFLTVAVPQAAGKTTTANAVLALRPEQVPLHHVAGEPDVMDHLKRERLGGYLVVGEFSRAPMPSYIWGEPVRRVFDTMASGYSLQTSLHAPGVDEAMRAVTAGNGVPDSQASLIKLVLYIERFGSHRGDFWRRVTELYEVERVQDGRPVGQPLFRWQASGDRFEQLNKPAQFGSGREELQERSAIIGGLAQAGRTDPAEVANAVAEFRSRTA